MDSLLAGCIALAFLLGIVAQLSKGQIWLFGGPNAWRFVDRNDDPGRFWAFIIAEIVVLVLVIVQGLAGAE